MRSVLPVSSAVDVMCERRENERREKKKEKTVCFALFPHYKRYPAPEPL